MYDSAGTRLFFRRGIDRAEQSVDLARLDFSPRQHPLAADLTKAGPLEWVECTRTVNRDLLQRSYRQTPFLKDVPDEQLDLLANAVEAFLPAGELAAR